MATVSDLKDILKEMSEKYPHYCVGEGAENSEGKYQSWIVDVFYDGDFILQKSDEESQDRDKAITVEKLYQSFLSLAPKDDDPVELSLVGSTIRLDSPIVGLQLNYDKEVLIFYAPDRREE